MYNFTSVYVCHCLQCLNYEVYFLYLFLGRFALNVMYKYVVCVYMYIYIYVCVCVYIYMCIYGQDSIVGASYHQTL